jgi:hypothetical protein
VIVMSGASDFVSVVLVTPAIGAQFMAAPDELPLPSPRTIESS